MKMTVELPDPLVRQMKILAVHEHKKLKEVVSEVIARGMRPDRSRRIVAPKPVKLKGRAPLTIDEIEAAIHWGRKLPKPLKLRGGFLPTTADIEAAIAEGRE
jgi:hypothetical protein